MQSDQHEIELLSKKVYENTQKIDEIEMRISRLEQHTNLSTPHKMGPPTEEKSTSEHVQVTNTNPAPTYPPQNTPPTQSQPKQDFESNFGKNYLGKVGITGILFGIAYFFKYAFENDWIGPVGRVILGYAVGATFLCAGEVYRKKYTSWFSLFTGGGLAVAYIVSFAAHHVYHLFSTPTSLIVVSSITVMGSFIASTYNSKAIAFIGLIGGLLTPFVAGIDPKTQTLFVLSYIFILSIGITILSCLKSWYSIFLSTVVGAVLYLLTLYTNIPTTSALIVTWAFFALFTIGNYISNIISTNTQQTEDEKMLPDVGYTSISYISAITLFGIIYDIYDGNELITSLVALCMTILYATTAILTQTTCSRFVSKVVAPTLWSLSALSITISIAEYFSDYWITFGWHFVALSMVVIGLMFTNKTLRVSGLILTILATNKTLFDISILPIQHIAIFNTEFLLLLCAAVTWAIIGISYLTYKEHIGTTEKTVAAITLHIALILGVITTTREISLFALPIAWQGAYISMWWALLLCFAIGVSAYKQFKYTYNVITIWYAIFLCKVLFIDLLSTANIPGWFLYNPRTISAAAFTLTTLLLGVCVSYIHKEKAADTKAYTILAIVTPLMAISQDIWNYIGDSAQATQVAMSIFWGIYACICVFGGMLTNQKLIRTGGMILFVITILKVIFIDMFTLDIIYKIIAFIVLGTVLLFTSYFYQERK